VAESAGIGRGNGKRKVSECTVKKTIKSLRGCECKEKVGGNPSNENNSISFECPSTTLKSNKVIQISNC